jgi:hypothetical protein
MLAAMGDGDRVKELRKGGMSEREATLVNMRQSKKARIDSSPALPSENPYPYGLCLDLNQDSLEKLGISEDDMPAIGATIPLRAEGKVTRVSALADEQGGGHRTLTIQITKMAKLGAAKGSDEAEYDTDDE